jgi:hypothetical protein
MDNGMMATIKMTKTLYSQLACQPFYAPKGYPMPKQSDPLFKAHEIGMKLVSLSFISVILVSY